MEKRKWYLIMLVGKPALVRLLLLVLLVASVSCNLPNAWVHTIVIAKAIPPVYIAAGDEHLNFHQDTLYIGHQYFTGHTYALYNMGDTQFVKSYYNGLEEGSQKAWHPNGQLEEHRLYFAGKKEGEQKAWWPDGKPRFSYSATNDVYTGELKEWDSKGMLYRDFNYVDGQEEGSEKLWWPDGSIRANYVIHGGKRYGLLGMKLCANRVDTVNSLIR